jgi:hypothetical protein
MEPNIGRRSLASVLDTSQSHLQVGDIEISFDFATS